MTDRTSPADLDTRGVSETPEQRKTRVQEWTADNRECVRCGCRRIHVFHEPDPENAPEGSGYYAPLQARMHPFQSRPTRAELMALDDRAFAAWLQSFDARVR